MVEEVLHHLRPRQGGRYVDGTLGDGGHTERILMCHPSVEVLGLDRDPLSLAGARSRLGRFDQRLHTFLGNFSDIGAALTTCGWSRTDGIVLDLGVSSRQLDDPARGFSFRAAGPLDMRMTPDASRSAADVVATADERELADIFRRYGEEPAARRIARAIVREREIAPITDTAALADLVARSVPRRGTLHPATRVFQALRIAVNDELGHLERFLAQVLDWLAPAGRLVVIAYHSLEDRLVKRAFQDRDRWETLSKKPLVATEEESAGNPRARSAKLRAARRLP